LWPGEIDTSRAERLGFVTDVYGAEVVRVDRQPCSGSQPSDRIRCDKVRFRLTQGPDSGETRTIEFPDSPSKPELGVGDHVVLGHIRGAEEGRDYQYSDRQRRPVLLVLVGLFALAVVLLGRWRGVAALVGLGVSIWVLLAFVVPAIVDGESAPLVAITGASAIAFLALYLAHGLRSMTTVALLGTLGALALTVGLAFAFTSLAHFSGFTGEETGLVQLGTRDIDLVGLVLAGMVLGALGALDDVTVTQASAVWELRAADPRMGRRDLYRTGLRIGRDHVASAVNTLALAYAGAALPILILFVLSQQSLGTVANGEVVATEIVATLVGSIGLVVAVPLTTWLAATVAAHAPQPGAASAPDGRGRVRRPARARRRRPGGDDFWRR
jgi:uncharacterized membrane protein